MAVIITIQHLPTIKVEFLHGVASGDPLKDRVILWTRITPQDTSLRLEVVWEIATDDKFTQVIILEKYKQHQLRILLLRSMQTSLSLGNLLLSF